MFENTLAIRVRADVGPGFWEPRMEASCHLRWVPSRVLNGKRSPRDVLRRYVPHGPPPGLRVHRVRVQDGHERNKLGGTSWAVTFVGYNQRSPTYRVPGTLYGYRGSYYHK